MTAAYEQVEVRWHPTDQLLAFQGPYGWMVLHVVGRFVTGYRDEPLGVPVAEVGGAGCEGGWVQVFVVEQSDLLEDHGRLLAETRRLQDQLDRIHHDQAWLDADTRAERHADAAS